MGRSTIGQHAGQEHGRAIPLTDSIEAVGGIRCRGRRLYSSAPDNRLAMSPWLPQRVASAFIAEIPGENEQKIG